MQSDQHLLDTIAAGDDEAAAALGALYDAHARVVFGLAKRVLGKPEDAEEVVQDVFAQVWRDARKYEPSRATVAGWLVMLTRTRAIDKLRARKARPDLDQAHDPVPLFARRPAAGLTPEAMVVSKGEAAMVGAALEALPDEQRAFINLAYFEGLSQSEIAARTGTPLGTVKTRMRTALHSMRAALTS